MQKAYMKKRKGFTLIEVLVTTFMFGVIIGAVSYLFGQAIESKKNVSAIQGDYEKAQSGMNLVAKILRTSSVYTSDGKSSDVRLFDYSQDKCLSFRFSGEKLQMGSNATETADDCEGDANFSGYRDLADTRMDGFFDILSTDSTNNIAGKVTISLTAKPQTGNERDEARIQTTVSLRDYE